MTNEGMIQLMYEVQNMPDVLYARGLDRSHAPTCSIELTVGGESLMIDAICVWCSDMAFNHIEGSDATADNIMAEWRLMIAAWNRPFAKEAQK